jgi:hypothetical protein
MITEKLVGVVLSIALIFCLLVGDSVMPWSAGNLRCP